MFLNYPELDKLKPEKIKFLEQMSDELKTKKQDEILPFLLAVTAAANERKISFSDEEASFIIECIYPNQTPEDKKRISEMKNIAKMLEK